MADQGDPRSANRSVGHTGPVVKQEITVDLPATRRRIARLQRYVKQTLLDDGEFLCPHWAACRGSSKEPYQFREGTMSHVGRRFNLAVNGKPLRVMVVGQESELPKDSASAWGSRVSMESRHQQIHDGSGLEKRYYASEGRPGRNPHMRGTTSVLRLIFGAEAGEDYDGEFVRPANGRPFPLLRRLRPRQPTPVLNGAGRDEQRRADLDDVQELRRSLRGHR